MNEETPIRVAVTGAAGRMGRMLVAAVCSETDMKLSGATEAPGHPDLGRDAGTLAGVGELGVILSKNPEEAFEDAQVIIDFTSPASTMVQLELCAGRKLPAVIGTTGLTDDDKRRAEELASSMPVVLAPNMSAGVNLLFHLVQEAARALGPGFDIEIVEAHHRMKKDAPSGTALRLGELAAEARGLDIKSAARLSRDGMIGERPRDEIGIQTVRGGDIVGEHTVIYAGMGERIELTHRAHGRETFARGAVMAVRWVMDKSPGCYDMRDVLGIKDR